MLVVVYDRRVRLRGGFAVFAGRPAKQMARRAGGQRTAHSGTAVLCCCVGWRHAAAVALVGNFSVDRANAFSSLARFSCARAYAGRDTSQFCLMQNAGGRAKF